MIRCRQCGTLVAERATTRTAEVAAPTEPEAAATAVVLPAFPKQPSPTALTPAESTNAKLSTEAAITAPPAATVTSIPATAGSSRSADRSSAEQSAESRLSLRESTSFRGAKGDICYGCAALGSSSADFSEFCHG
jgi:hypothetical protein